MRIPTLLLATLLLTVSAFAKPPTATKVGEMSGAMEAIEDLENLLAHLRSGDRVLVAVDNSWFH